MNGQLIINRDINKIHTKETTNMGETTVRVTHTGEDTGKINYRIITDMEGDRIITITIKIRGEVSNHTSSNSTNEGAQDEGSPRMTELKHATIK